MANCSDINNTTIKGTSAISYDSTPLPCTGVTTCDGLNTILAKFDTVICDVKANVDSLTEDIITITEDVMIITEDVIDIQNQLNICCTTTTTTSSTSTTTSSTSTTTTTTTQLPLCIEVELNVGTNCPDELFALFEYTDCSGNEQIVEVGTGDLPRFCVLDNPYPSFVCGDGTITLIAECDITTTTTTTVILDCELAGNGIVTG